MSWGGDADEAPVGTSVPPPGYAAEPLAEQPPPVSRVPGAPRRGRPGGRKLIAGGVGLAVLVGLAFLLLGSTGSQLTGPIAQAATLSSSTPGYRMHMSIDLTSSGLPAPITGSANGVVDLHDDAASMSLVMNLGDEPQVIQQLGSSTLRMDMIADGPDLYVKLPSALMSELPTAGKQWIEANLSKLAHVPGVSSLGSNPTTSDPSHILQYLESASDSVLNFGPARVDGVETTHYRAYLSLTHLADRVPSADQAAAQQAISALQQADPTGDIPVDVWIDAHHLVRRVDMTMDLNLPGGQTTDESMTMDMTDYGPQARPAPPSAEQVINLNSLSSLGGS